MRIRKARTIIIRFEARPALNLVEMLQGTLSVAAQERPVALSVLTGKARVLADHELRLLSEMSSWEWISADSLKDRFRVDARTVEEFLSFGFLIGDGEETSIRRLKDQEELLATVEWDEFAFYYHMMNRTKDSDPFQDLPSVIDPGGGFSHGSSDRTYFQMMTQLSEQLRAVEYQCGPAPPHFYEASNAKDRRELPPPEQEGPLFDLLRRRKTVRLFDPDNPMTENELSTVLYFTFGCHGSAALTEGMVALRKTSPSGGALHPIEAYPVILNVRGWTPGIYHYNVQNHRMDLLRNLERQDGVRLVSMFAGGQSYFATAHVVFILAARFQRNFWKYRRAPRSFRVIQLDAGHLSQTMYLVCAAMGLGAFFTAAINDINIEEALGIDAVEQGVVGILGCGRAVSSYALTFETIPYVPREPST